ncbi:hypothetical protein [Massilia genomosp. 1]|uniref:Uncharacterized protein n=1 Tax=Massilia genomosp. 1 TaxID=2609280 RepID=A0ABX0MX29_9BURK|nr:hypothetical protein [Massilia genomosp. 1]NHZ67046.1 hypothetical protein [Massilia genomosp. 1]
MVALAGLAAGYGGGMLGGWAGGMIFGQGSDGQKWSALGVGALTGMVGGRLGTWGVNKALPSPITPGKGFIKGGLPGMRSAQAAGAEASAKAFTKPLAPIKAPTKNRPTVFDKRTREADATAKVVVDEMAKLKIKKKESPSVQILTHEDGTVSVGLSGSVKSPKFRENAAKLQAGLDALEKGKYKVSTTTLDKSNGIKQLVDRDLSPIGPEPGVCAEAKAAAVAAENPSPINGAATVWRGKADNPHPYNNENPGPFPYADKKAHKLSKDQMCPCMTCADASNSRIYHDAAVYGKIQKGVAQ